MKRASIPLPRGFTAAEFRGRTARAQRLMAQAGLSALLLTTEADVRYFTGFLTRFWESPTRPWFVIVPSSGEPVAVIPSIGAALMQTTWINDIRTWAAPDLEDDGVILLADTLRELAPDGPIGLPSGHQTHLRMPLADHARLSALLGPDRLSGDHDILRRLRAIKSPREIDKITNACAIVGRAFARVPEIAGPGTPLDTVFRHFQMLCLEEGADWVPYLAGGAGPDGYTDVISPATQTPLQPGDVMMLDTGCVWDGYFCDFDRNFAIGSASTTAQSAHAQLMEAIDAGFTAARPGAEARDVFHAMSAIAGGGEDAGRLGHGLGMQLTEGLSFTAQDPTVIEVGMVLTLEPGVETHDGRIMVHEEDIVITDAGAEFLSPRAANAMTVLP